ncbi:MAG: calcium-binding protein, partial [Methanomethylophilus sp.]
DMYTTNSTSAIAASGDLILNAGTVIRGTDGTSMLRTELSSSSKLSVDVTGELKLQQVGGNDLFIARIHGGSSVTIDVLDGGDMIIGPVFSATSADLKASGSILDAFDDDAEAPLSKQPVISGDVVLTAGGSIGTDANFVELNLLGSGTTGTGILTATAAGDIHVQELSGDMLVNTVESTAGDVFLIAQGDILDGNDADDTLVTANVLGRNIHLDASSIGVLGNALDIDSDTGNARTGKLFSTSDSDTYLLETSGDLLLGSVKTDTGDGQVVWLSVVTGSLVSGNPNAVVVLSDKTYLHANKDIGSSGQGIMTQVEHLESESTAGNTWITNGSVLAVGGVLTSVDGMKAGGSIDLTASDLLTVEECIDAHGSVTLTVPDDNVDTDPDTVDTLVVAATGTVHSDLQVHLRGGDSLLVEAGGTVSGDQSVDISGDYGNADDLGCVITVNGNIRSPEILISGGTDDDLVTIAVAESSKIEGHVQVNGGAGEDTLVVTRLHDRVETLDLDGQGGTDSYIVNTTGNSDYRVCVNDSGDPDDGADRLTINGTSGDDVFLLRSNFVAQMHPEGVSATGATEFASSVERIDYDETINARLRVNGMEGDDSFYSDDNSTLTTLDGGTGRDFFQVGQVFGSERTALAGTVAAGDEIETVETTLGILSRGISYATTIYGGDGNDEFSVYSNKAELQMFGEDGNDSFVVRAFVIKDSSDLASTDTLVSGGDGDDNIQYNINAPVSIDGGAGVDSVAVIGTEQDDNFVITSNGVQGAGLNIDFSGVEEVEVDGMEGDDHFFVLSTNKDMVTTIIGGLGSDTFDVGGDVTETIVASSVEGRSGFINHSVQSDDPAYDNIYAQGIDLNVANGETGTVMITQSGGSTVLCEDGTADSSQDSYTIKLAVAPPQDPTVAYLNVSAALPGYGDELAGGQGLEISVDGVNFVSALVLKFDSSVIDSTDSAYWSREQTIFVRAISDSAQEGERTVIISHSIQSTNPAFNRLDIANVKVTLEDDDEAGIILKETDNGTRVVEGATTGDMYSLSLTKSPAANEVVTVTLHFEETQFCIASTDPRFVNSNEADGEATIIFKGTDTDFSIDLSVTAVDDDIIEDPFMSTITHTVTSSLSEDGVYAHVTQTSELDVDVRDNDSGALLVTQTDGSTIVSTGEPDTYSLVLAQKPTADVTVSILTDGQTIASANDPGDSRFATVDGSSVVTFTEENWDTPFVVRVDVNPAAVVNPDDFPIQKYSAQPHSADSVMGPLVIEGGVIESKNRSVKPGVILPTETDTALPVQDLNVDEETMIDTLNVFNDGSVSSDTGVLQNSQEMNGLEALYDLGTSDLIHAQFGDDVDSWEEAKNQFGNISGLGMGNDLCLNFGSNAVHDDRTFEGGITYHAMEVVDVLLGQGNDAFTVMDTTPGTVTVVQGGGGDDTVTVTSGGGEDSPLVVFGDTSQDGLFYTSTTSSLTGTAREFTSSGNDTLDARGSGSGVVLYGGAGNDVIYGSQGDDQLAGGSGDDEIHGQDGNDNIYGDDGFNLDLSTRFDVSNSVLTVATIAGAQDSSLTSDNLEAGVDYLSGDAGNDILLGDHGEIIQVDTTNRIITTGQVAEIRTVLQSSGENDTLSGGDGNDRILGGMGADIITDGNGTDIILGDNGLISYAFDSTTGNSYLHQIVSTEIGLGGNDVITANDGNKTILGGFGQDAITVATGNHDIAGDNAQFDYDIDGTVMVLATTDTEEHPEYGDADTITVTGDGNNHIFGGMGADNVTTADGTDIILGDNGTIEYSGTTGDLRLNQIVSTEIGLGGNDVIAANDGNKTILGGFGQDAITVATGNHDIAGDNAQFDYDIDGAI